MLVGGFLCMEGGEEAAARQRREKARKGVGVRVVSKQRGGGGKPSRAQPGKEIKDRGGKGAP